MKSFMILLLFFINSILSKTTYISYHLDYYEAYATTSGCKVNFAVVLDDQYDINNCSNNIVAPYNGRYNPSYYENTLKLYSLNVNFKNGTINQNINFNVTNKNGETSNINIPLNKPFECKNFYLSQLSIIKKSDLYEYGTLLYGFDMVTDIPNYLDISSSITCTLSYASSCTLFKNTFSYFIYGTPLILEKTNTNNFTVTLKDLFGNSMDIVLNNTIFSTSTTPSIIQSYDIFPSNNSKINLNSYDERRVSISIKFNQLNSYLVIKNENIKNYISDGNLILGTPEEQTIYFSFDVLIDKSSYSVYDETLNNITKLFTINYEGYTTTPSQNLLTSIRSINQSLETGNLLFKTYIKLPSLKTNFINSQLYLISNVSSFGISYPYGFNKISNNSYWDYYSESMFINSFLGGRYTTVYYIQETNSVGANNLTDKIIIPKFPDTITSDSEGPILRNISYEQLENNKLLVTMNITDKGSGVFFLIGATPYFSFLAKEQLISGDINNGVYQILTSISGILSNSAKFFNAYDYMGNAGLNGMYDYTDLNYSNVSPILKNDLKASDITHFEFDRLVIDTSFDDLTLMVKINFTGANQNNTSVPRILPLFVNNDYILNKQSLGVYNHSSQMFDLKLTVPSRERGYFRYALSIPPLTFSNSDIEILFPNQRVKLTTNYVDHFPPIISNFRSLTNTTLLVNQGEEIEIGWEIDIYDYPVGLDYAYFEVVSSVDFEPYKFRFTPNTSVPGSDILSTYTAKFSVKPYSDQNFFISKCKLVDKNGYYSIYPSDGVETTFLSFFNNTFKEERNIQININPSSVVVIDNTPPQLLTFNFPTSVDSFGNDRKAIFEFTIKDENLGISLRHNPYIYIQFTYLNFLSAQSELVDNSTSIFKYRAEFEFAYGVLAYGAIVSIHGITDNSLNIVSYTSDQLKTLGFNSTIVNPNLSRPPVILEYTDLNEDGGKLYIYGKQFSNSPIIYMDQGNGFNTFSPVFTSNQAITLIIPSVKGIELIKFKIVSNGLESNTITIYPIINPVVPISNCSLLSNCSGKGECVDSKCICVEGSSGPDCSSASTEISNNTIPTPSFSSFGSMIEINQLVEIDINGNVVVDYHLDNWHSSTIKSAYQIGSNAYQYDCPLGQTGSNISIVVEVFKNSTTIDFAANKINMDKGTIKYTIYLNSYPFGSRFNTLQVRVNASISVENSNCKLNSYSLYDGTDSIQWIKLRSNDKSIFGKFIQYALIDYRSVNIQNKLLIAPTIENQQAVIGIQVPFFYQNAVLDPDFSILFDSDSLGENKDSSCYTDNSSNLSTSKIVIISVVCGVVASCVVILSIILIKKKREMLKFKKIIKLKQNEIN